MLDLSHYLSMNEECKVSIQYSGISPFIKSIKLRIASTWSRCAISISSFVIDWCHNWGCLHTQIVSLSSSQCGGGIRSTMWGGEASTHFCLPPGFMQGSNSRMIFSIFVMILARMGATGAQKDLLGVEGQMPAMILKTCTCPMPGYLRACFTCECYKSGALATFDNPGMNMVWCHDGLGTSQSQWQINDPQPWLIKDFPRLVADKWSSTVIDRQRWWLGSSPRSFVCMASRLPLCWTYLLHFSFPKGARCIRLQGN